MPIPAPMLSADASDVDVSTLPFPLLASPKLDGIRCIVVGGVAYSRNGKPIRNRHVQAWASMHADALHMVDGELIVGEPTAPDCLSVTQSGIMSADGSDAFAFYAFDRIGPGSFVERTADQLDIPRVEWVAQCMVRSADELRQYEAAQVAQGFEGVMIRKPHAPYKHGRSTMRELFLAKIKRFTDGEALVIGVEEGSTNGNEQNRDAFGRAIRSTDAAGLRPSGMVGTIIASHPKWGTLRIAPGTMTHADRVRYMGDPGALVGKVVHWRSFGYGCKDAPRFARFYGIREDV